MSVRGWVSQGPGVLRRTPAALVTGALAAGQELVWLTAHALTYPIGLLAEHGVQEDARYRTDTLSPLTRGLILADIAAAGRPVVLVHGIGDNRSAFTVLRRTLRRRGFSRIVTVNYSPLTSDVRKAAAALAGHVERVCEQSGYEQVFLVGHSLGGIIARYYVQRLGGDARVSTLVTLGSPHAGSQLARIAPLLVGRQLRPDSDLMRELAGPARCDTRFVAISSDQDAVVPHSNARLEHPDLSVSTLRVHGVGHLSLLVSSTVAHAIVAALASEADRLADRPGDRPASRSADRSGGRLANRSGDRPVDRSRGRSVIRSGSESVGGTPLPPDSCPERTGALRSGFAPP